jgi:outer membrane murein-binding lipoprotein Lpp
LKQPFSHSAFDALPKTGDRRLSASNTLRRLLAVLILLAASGCASQAELARMQGQVEELRKQLEHEKQNLGLQQEEIRKAKAEAASGADK